MAENGKEGIEKLSDLSDLSDVDLVITDIEMPIMDGFDFAKNVRLLDGEQSNVPIIAVSTRVAEKDILKGKAVGFTKHLEKLNKAEVIDAAKEFLQK
jgi:CheY-like chemotaxis protein